MRRYLVGQFVVAAFGVLWIGNLFAQSGARAVLLPCILLWSTLYSFGLLSESRSYALRFELVRLFGILPLGIAGLQHLAVIGLDGARSKDQPRASGRVEGQNGARTDRTGVNGDATIKDPV